ncbi:hypothetical protein AXF42_Ash009405 [Apostasia shenzhenica]|uniref:Uncharacterized protein n=1 Tax=Apostasia shenzhenica TaxID=1088818 RepID=A0A2I0B408_9ASPA|nr:hypothetical protein AXF42_Ash009405 [Apostasia shenzhenica]
MGDAAILQQLRGVCDPPAVARPSASGTGGAHARGLGGERGTSLSSRSSRTGDAG